MWGGTETLPSGEVWDVGKYIVHVEQSNGFGGFYLVASAISTEKAPVVDALLSRYLPQNWASCDQAIRGLLEGLP